MNILDLVVLGAALTLIEFCGMDAALIVLGWAVMGLLLFGFIGETIIVPWREERERREREQSET